MSLCHAPTLVALAVLTIKLRFSFYIKHSSTSENELEEFLEAAGLSPCSTASQFCKRALFGEKYTVAATFSYLDGLKLEAAFESSNSKQ